MTLFDWFEQPWLLQLLLIWCCFTYILGWCAIVEGFISQKKYTNPVRIPRMLIMLFLAPVAVPYVLWFK